MSNMIGADPQQLRDLAAFMKQRADLFDSIAQDLGQRLHSAGWIGTDGDHCRAQWDAELRPKLRSAVQALREASTKLMRNATEQVAASEGGGAGSGLLLGCGVGAAAGLFSGGSGRGENHPRATGSAQFGATQGNTSSLRLTGKSAETRSGMQPQELGRNNPKNAAKASVDVAQISGSASFAQVKGEVGGDNWGLKGQVDGIYAEGSAGARLDGKGLDVNAGVGVGLIHASSTARASYGIASAEAKVDALVGAEAKGKVSVGAEGVKVSGEAFAGARVKGEVGGDVGGVGGKAKAEGWAGIGIGGEGKFGFENGKLTFAGEAGAAFGVGGKAGFEMSIDVGKVSETVGNTANAVGDNVGKAANAVGDFCGKLKLW